MLEQTKRISFRISYVLSKVEPSQELEPDLHTGSNQEEPAPALQHCSGEVMRGQEKSGEFNTSPKMSGASRRGLKAPSRSAKVMRGQNILSFFGKNRNRNKGFNSAFTVHNFC